MPPSPYDYDVDTELAAIRKHQAHRGIPSKKKGRLLLATWNIRHLGSHSRQDKDLRLIAEILRPFDLIAVQEVKENFRHLEQVVTHLGAPYRCVMTDRAGNNERLAYIFNPKRVQPRELFGELVLRDKDAVMLPFVGTDGLVVEETLRQFDRNPFLVSWQAGNFRFTTANVHIYFGERTGTEFHRRVLEVYALAKWAHERVTKDRKTANDLDIILIGDMNVPKMDPDDEVFKQLCAFGMQTPEYSTRTGTNLDGVNHFDQIAFLPTETVESELTDDGVFDFDDAVFADLWDATQGPNATRKVAEFRRYCRTHISDHRPLWCIFNTTLGGG